MFMKYDLDRSGTLDKK
jgi:Ca2+-binding EF-hand superfamily protein